VNISGKAPEIGCLRLIILPHLFIVRIELYIAGFEMYVPNFEMYVPNFEIQKRGNNKCLTELQKKLLDLS
jgi:hypothetical protein